MMQHSLCIFFISVISLTTGQRCQGRFNGSLVGSCSPVDTCRGSLLFTDQCEDRSCCVASTSTFAATTCLREVDFDILYERTARAAHLRRALNYGINAAGLCSNCQAKAAFLAVAAAMTNDFDNDEAPGPDGRFSEEDGWFGNNQPGDGSRFRRRGLFGLRGRTMYERVAAKMPRFPVVNNPQIAALVDNAIEIAIQLWNKPDLLNGPSLTEHADGTFYGFSMLWYRLTGGIDGLAEGTKHYSRFLRHLGCGGDLYIGQGQQCQYNATHFGTCAPDCIRGLEEAGEYCGCTGGTGAQCANSPPHIRCCVDTCSQELKMDLGVVMDASGSVGAANYQRQLQFVKDLLRRVNVGRGKTHVGIVNFSGKIQTLTMLNKDYELQAKLNRVDQATFFGSGTDTAGALKEADKVFSTKNGLRRAEEGAMPVIFVITDGRSGDPKATVKAAQTLKDKGVHIVSVGIGNQLDLNELTTICTSPANENYFPMVNYGSLDQKLNQFTSKTCSEPTIVAENTTVITEVGKDKYKFLKIKIIIMGNKIKIMIKLFNGKVKLFYSFTSKNPKDPIDFSQYLLTPSTTSSPSPSSSSPRSALKKDDEISFVVDKPKEDTEFVYVGVKGMEEDNQFEVKFDDCVNVDCRSSATIKSFAVVLLLFTAFLLLFEQ